MRLADFILRDMESILVEWEAFAATLFPAAASMTPLALRDHAKPILEAVATDLSTPQTKQAQADKSLGRAPKPMEAPETAAQTHAILRARSGFDINQLAAEYRALRASVLRLWTDACQPDELNLEDVIRFNEAIDQALAESIGFFSAQVDRARNLLLGMLGHDMRNPLNAIQMTASYLAALNAGTEVSEAAASLIRSGASIKALLDDLVDFNRTKLGLGINIILANVDVAAVFADELEQLRKAYPGRRLELKVAGGTRGRWDGVRLQQLLRNLVSNAITYGRQTRRSVWCLPARRPTFASRLPTAGRPSSDRLWTRSLIHSSEAMRNRRATIPAWVSGCISCVKLLGRMGGRSTCAPTRQKPSSPCACLAAKRGHLFVRGTRVGTGDFYRGRPAVWAGFTDKQDCQSHRARSLCVADRRMRDEALTGTLRRNCGDGRECFSVRERAVLAEMFS